MLLSYNSAHKGCYYVAEDLDRTCAMMTVVNFLIHGITGEVIHHDSLEQSEPYDCCMVNLGLNTPMSEYNGILNIRPIDYRCTRLFKMNEQSKKVCRIQRRLEETRTVLCRKIKTLTGDELQDARRKLKNVEKVLSKYTHK